MNRIFFENLLPRTRLFNSFELVRCLSATDGGGVYLCRDLLREGRQVVVKILLRERFDHQNLGAAFQRELSLSQRVSHPNVLRGEEFFRDDEFIAYTMEFATGGTLATRSVRIPEEAELIRVLEQICSGLDAIHAAGILHRDLKPENVLVTAGGELRIADFGLALEEGASELPTHVLSGSINYIAPEYVSSGAFDRRSDIYSVGIIGYELATGAPPFEGESIVETLVRRVTWEPPYPHQLNGAISVPLSKLIRKAMHRDPQRRFQTAREMLLALREVASASGVNLPPRSGAIRLSEVA